MFIPRTTYTGDLPILSFVSRNMEPLGTKFNNIVDGFSGKLQLIKI